MMSFTMKPDQERVHALLVDTLTLLCKNGLNFQKGLKVEGVIGITVDEKDVFIVHINKLLQNDGRERCATFQDTDAPVKAELEKHSSLGRKGKKRSLSTNHQTDESSDDVSHEIPTDGTGFSSLDSNENGPYNLQVGFDSTEYKDRLQKLETNGNEVIFVKSEGSDIVDSYEESSIPLATPLSYSDIPVSESLVALKPQFQRSRTTRCVRLPEQKLNEKSFAISQYQCLPTDELADIDSNFATESTLQFKQEEDDPNSAEICGPDIDNNPYDQPSHIERQFTTTRKHSWYPRIQNSGFRNRSLGTGYSLQRKMEGEHFQVMSRFLCNFPNCNLSFSTKQNLLRHQTQKHGRQKSRTGHARRFSDSDNRFCDGI